MGDLTGDEILSMLEKHTGDSLPDMTLEQIDQLKVTPQKKEQLIEATLRRMEDRYLKPKVQAIRPAREDVRRDVKFCHALIRRVNRAAASMVKRLETQGDELRQKDQVLRALFDCLRAASPRGWVTGAVPPEHAMAWAESVEKVFGIEWPDTPAREPQLVIATEAEFRREQAAMKAQQLAPKLMPRRG